MSLDDSLIGCTCLDLAPSCRHAARPGAHLEFSTRVCLLLCLLVLPLQPQQLSCLLLAEVLQVLLHSVHPLAVEAVAIDETPAGSMQTL